MRSAPITSAIPLLTALAAGSAGCTEQEGLLIEITRDDEVPAPIDRLTIYAGRDLVAGGRFADQTPDSDVQLGDRDLATDPYRLLLSPTADSADGEILVAALAHDAAGEVVGFGALDRPV